MSKYDQGIREIKITPNVERNLRNDSDVDYIVTIFKNNGTIQYKISEQRLIDFIGKENYNA